MKDTRKPELQASEWRIEPETVDLEIKSRSVEHHSAVEPSAKYERGKNYESGPGVSAQHLKRNGEWPTSQKHEITRT